MDVLQIIVALIAAAGVSGGGMWAYFAKKAKTPDHQQAAVALGIQALEKQIEGTDRRETRWLEIEKFLRDELSKQAEDNDRLRELLASAHEEVRQTRIERDELRFRLRALARKVALGDPITLADVTGTPLGDLEDTQPSGAK